MEPTAALHSVETVLRLAIHAVIPGEDWLNVAGVPTRDEVERRHEEETKRRDGAVVSSDFLHYVETHHLTTIVEKKWNLFAPIFEDFKRTKAFFKIVLDVRNTIAHSRDLLPFERELLSGIAGQLSNQLSIFRSEVESSSQYYPTIETVTDSFGTLGERRFNLNATSLRLDVGQRVHFEGKAVSPRGHNVSWFMSRDQLGTMEAKYWKIHSGLKLDYEWEVSESEVGESRRYTIYIVSEGKYHRHDKDLGVTASPFDDFKSFVYSISPPMD